MRVLPFAILAALAVGHGPVRAEDAVRREPIEVRSPHADALQRHRDIAPPARVYPDRPVSTRKTRGLARIVYGYLPYWISDLSSLRLEDLSHLAVFAVEVNSDGSMGDHHGWPDTELVETAHAAGATVEVVFTLFSGSGLSTLLSSTSNRERCQSAMIDEMEAGGADGISVDFEGVPASARADFVLFLQELRAMLDARNHGDATIAVAAPSVDWGDAWDEAAIFEIVDVYFVMAYTYFWSGSGQAGPPGLFRTTETWAPATTRSTLRSVATIANLVGEDMRDKLVFGIPYYGREWTTPDDTWPTSIVAHQGAVTYSAARSRLAGGATRTWDDGICHPAIIENLGGTWHQVWYDDEDSLGCKYQLFREQELGGMGIWALGYGGSHAELWDLMEQHFTAITPLGPGSRDEPHVIDTFPFVNTGDTSTEGHRYFNFYGCSVNTAEYGREVVYRFDVCQPGALSAAVTPEADVDVNIHLLDELRESACLARDDQELTSDVTPGRYYLVVDTFVDSRGVEQEGEFSLSAAFTPEPGSEGCPAGMACDAGECACTDGLTRCDDVCAELSSNPSHCGECGLACDSGAECVEGICTGSAGCGCRADEGGVPPAGPLLLLAAALLVTLRRRH